MKKARAWLEQNGVDYEFHDFKTQGADKADVERWCAKAGWETVLNRSGVTFRKLPETDRERLTQTKAIRLMLAQPSMIKRPVVEAGGDVLVGFKSDVYQKTFT